VSEKQTRVEITGLTKEFGDVMALSKVDLRLEEKEFVSVVGRSGCGKSTLLSIIAGLEYPTDGTVLVDGVEVAGPGRDRGVVFQSATLLPWLTAAGNVEFALRNETMTKAQRRDVAREYLNLVNLTGFENAHPAQLSGGMQQRVALARSLSYNPSILLMDEPFGALDALTRREMQELLTQVWEKHKLTVMMVTHDIEEAIFTSDRVIVMTSRPGQIMADVPINLERPREPSMMASAAFREYYDELLGMIHHGVRAT
jgi:NitT/TauT family transport system ATP-binding protein